MTHVIAVPNAAQRDSVVQKIVEVLKVTYLNEPDIIIMNDRIGRIKVKQRTGISPEGITIKTICVAVIPMTISFEQLGGIYDTDIRYDFSQVIERIDSIRRQVLSYGKKERSTPKDGSKDFKRLGGIVFEVHGEY